MVEGRKRLKIGIIGCGGIAEMKHLPSLEKLPEFCEMVAFCDIVEARAVAAASKYGAETAKVYTDYQELLKDPAIDVVHVLTPNLYHSFMTIDALEAGKHVMCEKPMAINSQEARLMLDAAERTGKKLTIGYQNRFSKEAQYVYRTSQNGELGDVYMAKAHAIRRRAVPTWGVFTDKRQQGGGALIDIGTHALDLALWMMGNYKPKSVTGSVFYKLRDKPEGNIFGPWNPSEFDVEDSAFGFIKMENGATIFLECSWALNTTDVKEAKTSLYGTEGGAEMKQDVNNKPYVVVNSVKHGEMVETSTKPASPIAYFAGGSEDPGVAEARQWLQCILDNTDPLVKPYEAVIVTEILEAIYKSAETGKEVEL